MFALQKSMSKTNSRKQIAIKGVRDNILLLPSDQYRAVLKVSSLNFELKSEAEQDAIIDTYESFLNSVGSNLQIIIRTRQIDMDKYLEDINSKLATESEDIYKKQLKNYDEFIRSLITTNTILTRNFYLVIPYAANRKTDFSLTQEQMSLKIDIVSKGMARLGMQTNRLNSLEILDLFYSFYSPAQSKIQPLSNQALNLIHTTLVKGGNKNV